MSTFKDVNITDSLSIGGVPQDYIIDTNITENQTMKNGVWKYRKYKSNFIEAWFKDWIEFGPPNNNFGDNMYYTDISIVEIPFNINTNYTVQVSCVENWSWININSDIISKNNQIPLRLFRATPYQSGYSAFVQIYIAGYII